MYPVSGSGDEAAIAYSRAMAVGVRAAMRLEKAECDSVGLAPEERAMLYQDARAGAEAALLFQVAFRSLALRFAEQNRDRYGLEDLDLAEACMKGIVTATWKYDPENAFSFRMYAKFWMRSWAAALCCDVELRSIGDDAQIRAEIERMEAAERRLESASGCGPSVLQLADAFGVTTARVHALHLRRRDSARGYDHLLNLDADLRNPLREYLD